MLLLTHLGIKFRVKLILATHLGIKFAAQQVLSKNLTIIPVQSHLLSC